MSSALAALAEDPELYLEPPEGAERFVDERYCVVIGSERRWAGVCRLRLADEQAAVDGGARDPRPRRRHRAHRLEHRVVGRPSALPDRLRRSVSVIPSRRGSRSPQRWCSPTSRRADGVEIRRIETFDDHLAGLEIMLAGGFVLARGDGSRAGAGAADVRPAHAAWRAAVARSRRRDAGCVRHRGSEPGRPVPRRRCDPSRGAGAWLLPRSRPCALGRGRRLGLPGLAVQAQYGSSAPILRRLGFVETATIHTLRSPAAPD